MPALFALDQNFPEPIIEALNEDSLEAELVPLRAVDAQLDAGFSWVERATSISPNYAQAVYARAWTHALSGRGPEGREDAPDRGGDVHATGILSPASSVRPAR